jgi:acetyltransferase-like isoleucine patch superfamily enzyme
MTRPQNRNLSIAQKLAVRAYTLLMRAEGMWALPARRYLVGVIVGRRLEYVNIFPDVFIEGWQGLNIANNVSLNRGCNLSCFGGVTIGEHVSIGHCCSIISTNHGFSNPDVPIRMQPSSYAPVSIGRDVWLGAKVTVLAGVEIASGTVVAAGSIVTRSVEQADSIIAGIPAKWIKSRFD